MLKGGSEWQMGFMTNFTICTTACSFPVGGENCQSRLLSIEGTHSHKISVYNLNTIGTTSMIDEDGIGLAIVG